MVIPLLAFHLFYYTMSIHPVDEARDSFQKELQSFGGFIGFDYVHAAN